MVRVRRLFGSQPRRRRRRSSEHRPARRGSERIRPSRRVVEPGERSPGAWCVQTQPPSSPSSQRCCAQARDQMVRRRAQAGVGMAFAVLGSRTDLLGATVCARAALDAKASFVVGVVSPAQCDGGFGSAFGNQTGRSRGWCADFPAAASSAGTIASAFTIAGVPTPRLCAPSCERRTACVRKKVCAAQSTHLYTWATQSQALSLHLRLSHAHRFVQTL